MYKNVSIILPIRNEEKYISRCLDSILSQDYPQDEFEILAIDGVSDDGTCKILNKYAQKHTSIKIINNPDKSVSKALNSGIKKANGEIIVRMDAHSIYASDYISKCVECLNKTAVDNVGGPMRVKGENYISKAVALAHNSNFGLGGGKFHDPNYEGEVDTAYLGCWLKKVFDKYGYFDERLIRNQDIEFNSRIRKNGGKIFLTPEIKSYYYCRSNLKDLWIQNFRNGFWNIKTIKITPGSLSFRHFAPLFFVLGLLISWIVKPIWFVIAGSYFLCNLFFSLKLAIRNGFKYVFVMPIVFLTLHLSYGLGLLVGIFNLLRKENYENN